jgi:O-antigen/teichoic acid export membrane protein
MKSSPKDSPQLIQKLVRLFASQSARAGYLAASDQGLISLSNFLATLLLARYATPTELGVYGVGFTSLRLIRALQEGLTIQPLNTFGAALKREAFKRYATSTSMIQIALALLGAAGAAVLGWALTELGNDTLGPGIYALWPAFLWWQLHEYIRRMLYTRGKIFHAALTTAAANLFRLGLMLWWVRQEALNGALGLQAIALGSLLALLPGLWFTRHYWSREFDSLVDTWRNNWGFGRWILGGNLTNWVAVEFYPVLTAGMVSFAAAGAYRAIQTLLAPIHLLLRAIDTYITPRAARSYHVGGLPALQRVMRLTYLATGLPVLGLLALGVLFREQLLELLYGETYLPYQQGVILMAVFYALWFAYWPLQSTLKAARISRPIFVANLAAIAAMFSIGIWMISRWDVYGTIGGQAVNALIVNMVLWSTWRAVRLKNGI